MIAEPNNPEPKVPVVPTTFDEHLRLTSNL